MSTKWPHFCQASESRLPLLEIELFNGEDDNPPECDDKRAHNEHYPPQETIPVAKILMNKVSHANNLTVLVGNELSFDVAQLRANQTVETPGDCSRE